MVIPLLHTVQLITLSGYVFILPNNQLWDTTGNNHSRVETLKKVIQ